MIKEKIFSTGNFEVLDCTLRDGGYYNDWFFSSEIARKLAEADARAGIKYIELGFRSPKNESYKGPFYFSQDEYINSIKLPPGLTYLVMINLAEYLTEDGQLDQNLLETNFTFSKTSQIQGVRIACRMTELEAAAIASEVLWAAGYLVMVNVMQSGSINLEQASRIGEKINSKFVEVLYLADSTGSERPEEISQKIQAIRKSWTKKIGFHAHDNLGLALQNAAAAIEAGATFIDATVLGMGRGPGNLKLEELLLVCNYESNLEKLDEILEITESYFQKMQAKYNWGYSPLFVISGLLGVHPTYPQEIINQKSVSLYEGMKAIQAISKASGDRYNASRLIEATQWYSKPAKGDQFPSHLKQKSLILLGPCEIGEEIKLALRAFANSNQMEFVALNNSQKDLSDLITTRFYADPLSINRAVNSLEHNKVTRILPLEALPEDLKSKLHKSEQNEILNFGLELSSAKFCLLKDRAVVRKSLAVHYALTILSGADLKSLYIAGFDGYEPLDPRQEDSLEAFRFFEDTTQLKIRSLTPNTYDLETISPFGPLW
jgi:4-hydroxy 2-oxovalerate aldolase